MILYLHGFRSSPQSFKARLLADHMYQLAKEAEYQCPQLPASPYSAINVAKNCIKDRDPTDVTIIGSSLGGYYATWLAEQTGCRAVLLNPAINPALDLEKYIGISAQYHCSKKFDFKREYISELQALKINQITMAKRYFLIAATGDKILEWREMACHYPNATQKIIQGSDHNISEFAKYVDVVLAFCGVTGDHTLKANT